MAKPTLTWPLASLVEVEWRDACTDTAWGPPLQHRRDEGAICRTAGYLMKADRRVIQIALNQSAWSGNIADVMTIPRSQVTRIHRLRRQTK